MDIRFATTECTLIHPSIGLRNSSSIFVISKFVEKKKLKNY